MEEGTIALYHDVLVLILARLSLRDLLAASHVSRALYDAALCALRYRIALIANPPIPSSIRRQLPSPLLRRVFPAAESSKESTGERGGQVEIEETLGIEYYLRVKHLVFALRVLQRNLCAAGSFQNALAYQRTLYTWGAGNLGQLGDNTAERHHAVLHPQPVATFAAPIAQVACGAAHTVAVLEDGSCFTFGDNRYHQLGSGDVRSRLSPERVTFPSSVPGATHGSETVQPLIAMVACGGCFTLFLTTDGDVLSCGRGLGMAVEPDAAGQESEDSDEEDARSIHGFVRPHPTAIRLPNETDEEAPITSSSQPNSRAVTQRLPQPTDQGDDKSLQPSLPSTSSPLESLPSTPEPARVRICEVSAGIVHSLFLDTKGHVYSSGRGCVGQLGLGPQIQVSHRLRRVEIPEPAVRITAGSFHSLVLTVSGRVFAWGEGTFGKLGLGGDVNVFKPAEVLALRSHKIMHISAHNEASAFLSIGGRLFVAGKFPAPSPGARVSNFSPLPEPLVDHDGRDAGYVLDMALGESHLVFQSPDGLYSLGRRKGFEQQLGRESMRFSRLVLQAGGEREIDV